MGTDTAEAAGISETGKHIIIYRDEAFCEFLEILGKRIQIEYLLQEASRESTKYRYRMEEGAIIVEHA